MQIKSIRGRYFAILRRPDGGHEKVALGTRDEEEAKRIASEGKLQEMEYAALAGGAALQAAIQFAGVTSAPLEAAVEEYLEELRQAGKAPNTVVAYEGYLKTWMNRYGLGNVMVSDIKPKHVEPFINTAERITLSTRCYRLTVLKCFFDAQIKKCRALHNPCNPIGVRRHELPQNLLLKRKTHAFTAEEYERLLAAAETAPFFWHFMLVFGKDSALRPVDIASMEVVNLEGDTVRLLMRKTGREVELPVTPRMRLALEARPPNGSSFLFPDYRIMAQNPYSRAIQGQFRALSKRAGVTNGSLRSLRKMGAMQEKSDSANELRELIERESTRRAAEKLGHSSEATTKKFYL